MPALLHRHLDLALLSAFSALLVAFVQTDLAIAGG